jgi:nicotinamide-nucleotide amidase
VTYSNAMKMRALGIRRRSLERYGAVSRAVAREMARGALRASGADIAVAVTGIAGPDGGSPDKPVGTVWFCWALRRGRAVRFRTLRRRFSGNRSQVRSQTVALALSGVRTKF